MVKAYEALAVLLNRPPGGAPKAEDRVLNLSVLGQSIATPASLQRPPSYQKWWVTKRGPASSSAFGEAGNRSKHGKNNDGDLSSDGRFRPKVVLASHQEPTYYIGGSNGNAILEEVLNGLHWRRVKDKHDDTFRLKWCELKTAINYNSFKEGEQMVNHIPNGNLLTNKLGLLNTLQEYDRVCTAMKKRVPKLDFIPETFRLDDVKDRDACTEAFKHAADSSESGSAWICKPTGRNQGKGIFLVRTQLELEAALQENDAVNQQLKEQGKPTKPLNRIIQRYLHNPLLTNGKKFDLRAYVLVASTMPYLVVFQSGYVRLSMHDYDFNCPNLATHLTNQFVQKRDPSGNYKEMKEDTLWSMDRFNDYVNRHMMQDKGLEKDWVLNGLVTRMKAISTYCFNAVKHRLQCKVGYFDLYGMDFMIDEDMKVWLIEINVNPTLSTNCEALKAVIPDIVKETLYLTIECFEKSRKGRALNPLQSLNKFQVLFNASKTAPARRAASPSRPNPSARPTDAATQRSRSLSPQRRTRSLSPTKEVTGTSSTDSNVKNRGSLMLSRTIPKATPTSVLPPILQMAYAKGTKDPAASVGHNAPTASKGPTQTASGGVKSSTTASGGTSLVQAKTKSGANQSLTVPTAGVAAGNIVKSPSAKSPSKQLVDKNDKSERTLRAQSTPKALSSEKKKSPFADQNKVSLKMTHAAGANTSNNAKDSAQKLKPSNENRGS